MRDLRELPDTVRRDRAWERRVANVTDPEHEAFGGCFRVDHPGCRPLVVIASTGGGWDLVSVQVLQKKAKTPTWGEMQTVARIFFLDHETCVQYQVPPADHVNIHHGVLHLCRLQGYEYPRPPAEFV